MSAVKYWVWLSSLYGLGSRAAVRLLEVFGDPMQLYFAPSGELEAVEGLTDRERALLANKDLRETERILDVCERTGVRILTRQDADYPARLSQIYDAPQVLYLRGKLPFMDESPAVAVVGTRRASPYGVKIARELGYQIVTGGGIVVTGLALGIDGEAARGALLGGGKCVGVLGSAIDVDYPPQNRSLIADVAATGCVMSEYPPGCSVMNFPRRNRIISGLAAGTCVVEAPAKSGALITAEMALEQGRDVFAVPGNVDNPNAAGCNELIREGARLVRDGADILSEYRGLFRVSPQAAAAPNPYPAPPTEAGGGDKSTIDKPEAIAYIDVESMGRGCSEDQKALLRLLAEGERHVDQLIADSGFSAAKVLGEMTLLTIRGLVTALPGKRYAIKQK